MQQCDKNYWKRHGGGWVYDMYCSQPPGGWSGHFGITFWGLSHYWFEIIILGLFLYLNCFVSVFTRESLTCLTWSICRAILIYGSRRQWQLCYAATGAVNLRLQGSPVVKHKTVTLAAWEIDIHPRLYWKLIWSRKHSNVFYQAKSCKTSRGNQTLPVEMIYLYRRGGCRLNGPINSLTPTLAHTKTFLGPNRNGT